MKIKSYELTEIERDVRVEDLPKKNKAGDPSLWWEVANQFGPEVVVFISKKASGTRVDIPSYKKLLSASLDRSINSSNPLR